MYIKCQTKLLTYHVGFTKGMEEHETDNSTIVPFRFPRRMEILFASTRGDDQRLVVVSKPQLEMMRMTPSYGYSGQTSHTIYTESTTLALLSNRLSYWNERPTRLYLIYSLVFLTHPTWAGKQQSLGASVLYEIEIRKCLIVPTSTRLSVRGQPGHILGQSPLNVKLL